MTLDSNRLPDLGAMAVGILGGTGDQGRGLAYRLSRGGQVIRIGSRSAQRGVRTAEELSRLPGVVVDTVTGGDNEYACVADIVIVAVPWGGHEATLRELAPLLVGKVVVDCVNPLGFDKQGPYALTVPEGSAAQQAASLLPESRVCAAFHHLSATVLMDPEISRIESDVLVLSDDREVAALVRALAGRIEGVRGVWGGRLRNAGQVEAFTANLVAINKRYKAHTGVRVTGLPTE